MNNRDMPANPAIGEIRKYDNSIHDAYDVDKEYWHFAGETKFEKAFWQVYSAMLSDTKDFSPHHMNAEYVGAARNAIDAVNAGFKALEELGDE